MLELRRVTKAYTDGDAQVFGAHDISLAIEPGEFVALFGPSGSGKTTVLLLAAGILHPDSGSVLFDGREISAMSDPEATAYRLRDVGVVFQQFHLIPAASALDNAAVKLMADGCSRRQARRRATPWIDRVGLGTRAHRRPRELSGGEQQRVAVARALANDPRLVLADEPTGNLDTHSGAAVLALLAEICREHRVAVALATHDLAALDYVDRGYVLRDGRLTDEDPRVAFGEHRIASEAP